MADRPQNRKKNGKRRPVYDQARDARPSRPADRSNVGYPSSTTPGRHPVTNPNYDPDAPRPRPWPASLVMPASSTSTSSSSSSRRAA